MGRRRPRTWAALRSDGTGTPEFRLEHKRRPCRSPPPDPPLLLLHRLPLLERLLRPELLPERPEQAVQPLLGRGGRRPGEETRVGPETRPGGLRGEQLL